MLQIPSITQDDLNAFHIRVFGSAVTPTQVMPTGLRSGDNSAEETTIEDDDELGYYPDGNKRTLTDDQIAMFRHSEIYSILRERQIRMENKEPDGDDQPDNLASNTTATPDGVTPDEIKTSKDHELAHEAQRGDSFGNSQATFISPEAGDKRKRNSEDSGDKPGKASTRRLVRELDSLPTEDQVLDYGDGPIEKISSPYAHPGKASADAVTDNYGGVASVRGKKIWWPAIQAT